MVICTNDFADKIMLKIEAEEYSGPANQLKSQKYTLSDKFAPSQSARGFCDNKCALKSDIRFIFAQKHRKQILLTSS